MKALQLLIFLALIAGCFIYPLAVPIFLVSATVLIGLHEWGHLKSARRHGVTCTDFSIGMGMELWGRTSRQTGIRYSFRLLPIGGYVKMLMKRGKNDEKGLPHLVQKKQGIKAVSDLHPLKRIEIMGAGVFMNIVTAAVFFAIISFMSGYYTIEPVIAHLKPAENAVSELKIGDRIVAVNGVKTPEGRDVLIEMSFNGENVSTITVIRGKCLTEQACPTLDVKHQVAFTPEGQMHFGVYFNMDGVEYHELSITDSALKGITDTFELMKMQVIGISKIVTGVIPYDKALSGPTGIANIAGEILENEIEGDVERQGKKKSIKVDENSTLDNSNTAVFSIRPYFLGFLSFSAMFSVVLAVMNLLPIPVLDGGHIMFTLIEWARGKPLSDSVQASINVIGLMMMMGMFILGNYSDFLRFS
tara:strand:- start:5914 stop:7161 length:1248 start_codon:yes stop_codon:yes gene_type:complete